MLEELLFARLCFQDDLDVLGLLHESGRIND